MKEEVKNREWTQRLLSWYDHNKRELPWRDCGDPYKIWVSEVMSQQTRIEAMKPYYDHWMELFPTLEALAAASEEEVVHAWQGLGYYSRARNLRLGVQEVVEKYDGRVPDDRKSMESLKGVGSYTAGAILSMAYNKVEHAVDGNVLRIYSRLYHVQDDILGMIGKKQITALVQDTLPTDRPGDFNQSLMDFGTAVCIPKSPRCSECPITMYCSAYALGDADQLPIRIKKTKSITVPLVVGVLRWNGYYLLHKRPNSGLLRSMWEFPSVEGVSIVDAALPALEKLLKPLGFTVHMEQVLEKELTHVFSHRKWIMNAYRGSLVYTPTNVEGEDFDGTSKGFMSVEELRKQLPPDWQLLERHEFSDYTWAGPHGKLTELCK